MRTVIFSAVTLVVFVALGLNCAYLRESRADGYTYNAKEAARSGNYQKAVEDATGAIELLMTKEPKDIFDNHCLVELYQLRAESYNKLGNSEKAVLDYEKAVLHLTEVIRLREDNGHDSVMIAMDYTTRALIYAEHLKRDFDQAIKDATKAIELYPYDAEDYNLRARIYAYHLKRDFDQAIKDATKAIELEPEKAAYYDTRGWAYLGSGDNTRATDDFSKALQLDPNLESPKEGLQKVQESQAAPSPSAPDLDDF
jgi:tetratricopeptide (TPR) repeat protein